MAITETNFFDLFKAKLEKEAQTVADNLAAGAAQDYPSYREGVGMVRGLVSAQRTLVDLEDTYLKQDENDPAEESAA